MSPGLIGVFLSIRTSVSYQNNVKIVSSHKRVDIQVSQLISCFDMNQRLAAFILSSSEP